MTYEEIAAAYAKLAAKLDDAPETLPFGTKPGSSTYYLEFGENGEAFMLVKERGRESYRFETKNRDELLYLIFESVCMSLGYSYGLKHSAKNKDWRRISFPYAIEQIGKLSVEWQKKLDQHISSIIINSPYRDKPQ